MKLTWQSDCIVCLLICTNSPFFIAMPAKSEMAEIKNPSWQEVPGTRADSNSQDSDPAFINVNGIVKNGNVLTYDLVNSDAAGYERVQTNCKTGQFRTIRFGDFKSSTRVSYQNIVNSWQKPTSSYQRALLKFVCNL